MYTVHAALDDRLFRVGVGDETRVAETLAGPRFECLAAAGERVFAGTVERGLLHSPDGGDTWAGVGGFEDRVTAVTVDGERVWVGTEPSAVYRSEDGGDTFGACADVTGVPGSGSWSFPPRPHTHHVRWLAVAPDDPRQVYAAIEAGAFLRSSDGGASWESHPEDARRDNHTLATHPDAPERVYTAAGDGYAESRDRGRSWSSRQAGLDHRYVWGLAVDSGDPDRVVVSAASGAYSAHRPDRAESYVYRRTTAGAWERAMEGLPGPEGSVRAVLASGAAGEFHALTNRGLFRSSDGARSWATVVEWPAREADQVGRGLAVSGR